MDMDSNFISCRILQNKNILERSLPDALKLEIAQRIENNLFSKVGFKNEFWWMYTSLWLFQLQITFLSGLKAMGEIRTLFSAEVECRFQYV